MKQTILALLIGGAATRRQLPAMTGYQIGEGSYCRREIDEKPGRVEEKCKGCSARQCADMCTEDPTCAGFDFHERGWRICWLHYDYDQKLMTEGCKECDCYIKDGFEGKSEPPPQPPVRPDSIDGFEFQQGRCMAKSGKGYMKSRWEWPGTYWENDIDYYGCAKLCMDRDDCAGFDVYEGNQDCQLFFDEQHFGDGASEEECFVKVGFVDREPPKKPERPDQIDGFRFEQGKCMPKNGGGYMSSRWEVPGNYFADGIDYIECANRCRDRSDCAGFDIWEGNNDCQLFFDIDHFGDGTSEEECFIKDGFVGKKEGLTQEEWGKMFDLYTGNKGWGSLEEFTIGWMAQAPKEDNVDHLKWRIEANYKFADVNGDGKMSKAEFLALTPVIGSQYVDGMMYMDKDSDRMLSLEEFRTGYKEFDKYVEDGTINLAFKLGDMNHDGFLDFNEYMYIYKMKEGKLVLEENIYSRAHIDYLGYERFNGYCQIEGEKEPDMKNWKHTGIFDLDKCAKTCTESKDCNAFSWYHKTFLCYHFLADDFIHGTSSYDPMMGACFAKETKPIWFRGVF